MKTASYPVFYAIIMSLSLLLGVLSCEQELKQEAEPAPTPGVYKTEIVEQTSFRDANVQEKMQWELQISGESVAFVAYRDGKELSRKEGTYNPAMRSFMLKKKGAPQEDRHQLQNITDTSFAMQNGRVGLEFTKQ